MDLRRHLKEILAHNQKVLVVGLGISGIEASRLLNSIGIQVVAIDRQVPKDGKGGKFNNQIALLKEKGVQFHFGIDGEDVSSLTEMVGLAVISPGVSLESSICGALRRRDIRLVSEFELGLDLLDNKTIIVTGSNGKSTTVSLIDAMLKGSGIASKLCGNVGKPVVSEVSPEMFFNQGSGSNSVLVVEASSYQLESCQKVRPDIAVLLNISENHLERHGSLERYLDVKAKIFKFQSAEDYAFINADDANLLKYFGCLPAQEGSFRRGQHGAVSGPAAFINYAPESGVDSISFQSHSGLEEYTMRGAKLLGLHNRYNAAAAIMSARTIGAEVYAVSEVLQSFSPLAHRSELLGDMTGSIIINDSKSTTVASTVAAFSTMREAFTTRKVILMIGGLAKAGSWDPLMQDLVAHRDSLQTVICFGGDGKLLGSHCKNWEIPHLIAANLEQATAQALKASKESLILFSPGCASFDEFSDFVQRGEAFRALVAS